ncbi:MAG: triose-phosphate isomerase family protein [Candidatus Babeliales bacterium]
MKNHNFLLIANWKMFLTHEQEKQLCKQHFYDYITIAKQPTLDFVLCPNIITLPFASHFFYGTPVMLGAQTSGPALVGPYTGFISPTSLHFFNCHYVLVGHSEQRAYFHKDPTYSTRQLKALQDQSLTPVLCIGEEAQSNSFETVQEILSEQLQALNPLTNNTTTQCIIAYEPSWAIGSINDNLPLPYLRAVMRWIIDHIKEQYSLEPLLLYGGNVNDLNINSLRSLTDIHGLLIGRSSIDFQKLQKIVSLI